MKKPLLCAVVLSVAMSASVALAADAPQTNITTDPTTSRYQQQTTQPQLNSQAMKYDQNMVDTGYHQKGQNYENQHLASTEFNRDFLPWANFKKAILTDSEFRGANAANADFRGANLMGADLRWGKFYGADFRGADLSNTRLWGAKFQDAKYDANTKFPDRFIPSNHGLIQVQ